MQAAEIVKRTRLIEGEGEFVFAVERRRTEGAIRCDDGMRDVVIVFPRNGSAGVDGKNGQLKAEVVDRDAGFAR